jgi:mono/diheme cytochrome c family protein
MIVAGGLLWYAFIPESAAAAMRAAPVLNVLMALLFAATAVVFVLLFLGPYRNPGWIQTPGFAAALLLFGVTGFTTGEFIREAVRKPYIIYNVVLGNQVLTDEVQNVQKNGYLESGVWTKRFVEVNFPRDRFPELWAPDPKDPKVFHVARRGLRKARPDDQRTIAGLTAQDQVALGAVIFQYHCNDCHAVRQGYSAVGPLIQGWPPERIRDLVKNLSRDRYTMPPWCGTPEEAELLVQYLAGIAPPRPAGMLPDQSTRETEATR